MTSSSLRLRSGFFLNPLTAPVAIRQFENPIQKSHQKVHITHLELIAAITLLKQLYIAVNSHIVIYTLQWKFSQISIDKII